MTERAEIADKDALIADGSRELERLRCSLPRVLEESKVGLKHPEKAPQPSCVDRVLRVLGPLARRLGMAQRFVPEAGIPGARNLQERGQAPGELVATLRRDGLDLLERGGRGKRIVELLVQADREEQARTVEAGQRPLQALLDGDAALEHPGCHVQRPCLQKADAAQRQRQDTGAALALGSRE